MPDPTQEEILANVEFVDDREREFFATAVLGIQARDFLISPIGKYLHGRAKLELQVVKDEIAELNPHSWWHRRKWAKLAMRKEAAENFMRWMIEVITDGTQAERKLDEFRE
jgi:hypothetical protein